MSKRTPLPCSADNCADLGRCGLLTGYRRGCRCDRCYNANSDYQREYRAKNREKLRASKAAYNRENRDKLREYFRAHGAANAEYISKRRKVYAEANRERIAEAKREYYSSNRERFLADRKQRRENNPEKLAAIGRRYYEENKDRIAAEQREYRIANAERIADYKRQWSAKNPEKVRVAGQSRRARILAAQVAPITDEQWIQKVAYWGNKCYLQLDGCTGGPDHMEHVKPISKGGPHMLSNLRPACASCNGRKGNKWPFNAAAYKSQEEA